MRSDRNCLVSGVTKGTAAVRGGGWAIFQRGRQQATLRHSVLYSISRGEKLNFLKDYLIAISLLYVIVTLTKFI